jgi:hypothetical protein
MKKALIFCALIVLLSCNHDEPGHICLVNTCLVKDPATELDWLKATIENGKSSPSDLSKYFFLSMAVYNGNTVFMWENCCPFCDTLPPIVQNCSGEPIGYVSDLPGTMVYLGVTIAAVNPTLLKDSQIIWKPADFACMK